MAGVGSVLASLFKRIGLPVCGGCNSKAKEWDQRGVQWCEDNKPVLVSWLVQQSETNKINVVSAAAKLAAEEPLLAATIAGRKLVHPFTDSALLAAESIVEFAIENAWELDIPVVEQESVVVLNSNRHGFGDACVMAWVSEGSKNAPVKLVHHATNAKKAFLEMLGQEVVPRQSKMVDTFKAYSTELDTKGNPPRIYQRGRYLGITAEPLRPKHNLTEAELEAAKSIGDNAVLLFPNTDYGSREWPPFYWLDLADKLKAEGCQVYFSGGYHDARYNAHPGLWGRSWRETAAFMLASRLVVGNDSGPAHLAGTLDVPTIALLGPTTPSVFVQYPSVRCISATTEAIRCAGCYFHAPFSKLCDVGCAALCHVLPEHVFTEALDAVERQSVPC